MKHIKTINELFKSTYKNAAKKLAHHHKSSSNKLKDWAAKKGADVTQERIYPHRFIFDDSYENEFFSIVYVKHEKKEISRIPRLKITIFMKSNWDESREIEVVFDNFQIDINRTYRFENKDPKIARKNANHLLRFIKEYIEDELKDFKDREWKMKVHDFYKS